MSTIEAPSVDAGVWPLFEQVRKAQALAVLLRFSADRTAIAAVKAFEHGQWDAFAAAFPNDDVAWALVNLPYRVANGGARNKLLFVTWAPDALQRPTHRETILVQSSAVLAANGLRDEIKRLAAIPCQANDHDDLDPLRVLQRASRFELEPVDLSSVALLRTAPAAAAPSS